MALDAIKNLTVYNEIPNAEFKAIGMAQPADLKLTKTDDFQKSQENTEQENTQTSQRQIESLIKSANNKMKHAKTKCEFSYHEPTKRVSIKIIDKETDEVIREVPPEETLNMIEKIWELAGIMVDEKR